ncbi:MAG TPA: zinc ABC transporter substrate-binding protein [Magnetospirillaceae bacterium]|jgi:zinc/manganese transport system substrate-binding protein
MKSAIFVAALLIVAPVVAQAAPVNVVAAENFYGDLVTQIGGVHVAVTSILSNPDDDPHLFEASPSTARALVAAKLVVYNGVDYDPWMEKLLTANKTEGRTILVVGDLVQRKSGDNPHLWYNPTTMPTVAQALTDALVKIDPANKADYEHGRDAFVASWQPFQQKVAALHQKFAGTIVTATEPVAGYLCEALGLTSRNQEFQLAVENDSEPTPKQVADFENDLKNHTVKVLFYNNQATDDLAKRMQDVAHANKVPVVGVSETEPPKVTYQKWMSGELDALEKALAGGAS